ncbi:hypothetical protein MMC18_007183 [Xylographa bjoerkii]|nr:hypothetical protein [Xylographa bjoerkii]
MAAIDPFSIFPVEICLSLLSQNFSGDHDLVLLWTEVRHVSRTWRNVVDEFVRQKHLPYTFIDYRIDPLIPSIPATSSFQFRFNRMSDSDPSIAIFSDDKYQNEDPATATANFQDTPAAQQAWRYPAHIIKIRHFANDTPLLHSHFHWPTHTLHLDWRAVFSSFLYEEKLRLTLVDTWIRGIGRGWQTRAGASPSSPSTHALKNNPASHKLEALPYRRSGAWHENSSREARKRRLQRSAQAEGLEGWVWRADEREVARMQALKDERVRLDKVVFGDEAEGEEGPGGFVGLQARRDGGVS